MAIADQNNFALENMDAHAEFCAVAKIDDIIKSIFGHGLSSQLKHHETARFSRGTRNVSISSS